MTDDESLKVRGRRSPAWAIWSKMTIPCKDGLVYLVRRRIVATPWFGVYVHKIYEDDGDRDPHNHPWPFVSIVLRGGYVEQVWPDPVGARDVLYTKIHDPFSVHRMGQTEAHRVADVHPGTKTLILVGKRNKVGWGFFEPDGTFVDWETYEARIGSL